MRVSRLVGQSKAMEFTVSGDPLSADEIERRIQVQSRYDAGADSWQAYELPTERTGRP